MVTELFHQYRTVEGLIRQRPQWITEMDQIRIASYQAYEEIYWNIPEAFKLVQRGDDSSPIYIPSAKQIVETLHRFMANDITFTVNDQFGSDTERADALLMLSDMLDRERFMSEFTSNKRYGIIRGDWLWHVYADPERFEGSRISIQPLDPAAYFPIYSDENPDFLIGCHIVEPYLDNAGKERIRRLTYMKETGTGGPSPIVMWDQVFEVDAWGQPGTEMAEKITESFEEEVRLPDPIDSLPVYHIQNFKEPLNPWGSSELRGMEKLIAAINQSISDEELTLALEGLGVYTTTSGPPVDENGNDVPWTIGPGRVIEIDDEDTFKRVSGVSTVMPFQDHLKYLHDQLDLGTGTPAVAKGDVDVQLAESGVALAIRFGPLLARSGEKENIVTDVMKNMTFDLRKWFRAYETGLSASMENVRFLPVYGEKIPQNREKRFDEIMTLAKADPPIVSMQWVRSELGKIGYEFPDNQELFEEILDERMILGKIEADVEGVRIDNEIEQVESEIEEVVA